MSSSVIRQGVRENWKQFTLLVLINAFVGGMIGLERSILPQIAEADFGIAAKTSILSFIVVFGITKAITNYYGGRLSNRLGRKNLLAVGWLFALPVPFILMFATNWDWIIIANIFLGINQGLAWSTTVVMKIDLAGEKSRGFAMGVNEFAGYLALAAVAFVTGWVADQFGLRPYPFYIGIVISVAGLLLTILFVKDTKHHVKLESGNTGVPRLSHLFWQTTWKHNNLGPVTQAGLVNNLNDAMVWGLLPLILSMRGFDLGAIGIIVAIYPAVWGIAQILTGTLGDYYCKRHLLFAGMVIQGLALLGILWATSFLTFAIISTVLGIGTALVYPTFLAAISDSTHPEQRAESLGVFRMWRDLGYAVGAMLTGLIADQYGLLAPVLIIAILTIASAFVLYYRMQCKEKTTLAPLQPDNG